LISISISDNLPDKIFSLLKESLKDRSRGLSESVKKIIQERVFVDILQMLVDYGNANILKSFKIRLEMDCYDDSDNFAGMEGSRA
jgi:hypothetical protein